MRLAVISGVTGQDGALLAALLLEKNYRVIGLLPEGRTSDFFRLDYLQIKDRITYCTINLLDETAVKKFVGDTGECEFYNLAAISSVGLSFQQPLFTFDFNTRSVLNILEAIRQVCPKTRFYQASSSEMFGNVGKARLPIKESFLFHPVSPYGISKASAHWLAVNYREAYKLQTCCGILFNHESALRPSHFVIKKIIRTALEIKRGDVKLLRLGNLSIVRDWGYAPLYVEAMWLMMQQEVMDDFLICSGNPTSLQDLVENVFNKLNLDAKDYVKVDTSLLRSLDLEIIYGDNTKAKGLLEWDYDMDNEALISRLLEDETKLMDWETEKPMKR